MSHIIVLSHITSSFIVAVPQVSFITKVQIMVPFLNTSRYYYKNKQNGYIAEFLGVNASIYYGNSWCDMQSKVSLCKAKYQMTNLKMIFNESGEVKVIFVKSKR